MPALTFIKNREQLNIPFEGAPVLGELLQNCGLMPVSPCGGKGKCGKCAVKLSGEVSPPDEAEKRAGTRLACRAILFGDAVAEFIHEGRAFAPDNVCNAVSPVDLPQCKLGIAIDIGTTNLEARIISSEGDIIASVSMPNPQMSVAADVIGRIEGALKGKGELLKEQITGSIENIIQPYKNIDTLVITGNTAMLYLLCGISPRSIATAPFKADELFGKWLDKPVKTYIAPCINAFNGGDTVCAVLFSGMCESKKTALLCDIGTNGEIALWKDGSLYVTSAAAGPAFEGAEISCGCVFRPDAIHRVAVENGRLKAFAADGYLTPSGICGSGFIDALAAFLELGYMDGEGNITSSLKLSDRVEITQKDVHSFQLAKSAVASGIEVLLEATGTSPEDIEDFYLAGSFGISISPENSAAIGLFPKALTPKVRFLGNAALKGAEMILLDNSLAHKAEAIASRAKHIQLGGDERFNRAFIKNISFPDQGGN